ncbi:unnamed protein product [Cuscuta epithymum]|uniref:Uncharacterized protein n=1 Tax=Cuscuta epithymum TaxID=186058 RepID=A0AAV0GLI7_9ASTE|nr:unnamed protein product [Cuscuta epithymum]CAH9148713.1 unnamed protein product [Cuscuta epithymum]
MTSKQIMEIETQGKKASFQYANKRLVNEDYIIQLRTNTFKRLGISATTYTVQSLHESSHHMTKKDIENPTNEETPSTSKIESLQSKKRQRTY